MKIGAQRTCRVRLDGKRNELPQSLDVDTDKVIDGLCLRQNKTSFHISGSRPIRTMSMWGAGFDLFGTGVLHEAIRLADIHRGGRYRPLSRRHCTCDVAATGDKNFVESAKDYQATMKDLTPLFPTLTRRPRTLLSIIST